MTKRKKTKSPPKIKVEIEIKHVSPERKQAWQRFWRKLISEVRADECKSSA